MDSSKNEWDVPHKSDESDADGVFDFPSSTDFIPATKTPHRSEKDGSCRIGGKDALRLRVFPPECKSCEKQRWPAKRSNKGNWHCGFCHRVKGGKPSCHRCDAISWDGWNGPGTRQWWCTNCWVAAAGDNAEEWAAWFNVRRDRFSDAFKNVGPELSPRASQKPPR